MDSSGDAARCVVQAGQVGARPQICPMDHFLVLSSSAPNDVAATGQFFQQIYDRFNESFTRAGFAVHAPSDKLVCLCLDSYSQLDAYGRLADETEVSWMDAYYSLRTNRVAVVRQGHPAARPNPVQASVGGTKVAAFVDPGRDSSISPCGDLNRRTVTHEVAHLLAFNTGVQNRSATYPFWLTEGLATNFEAGPNGAFGLQQQQDSCHRGRLIQAKASGRLVRLDRFAAMTAFTADSTTSTIDAYAEAWGLFHFLLEKHGSELRAYMADLGAPRLIPLDGLAVSRRFVGEFGPTVALEAEFNRFIDGLSGGAGAGSRASVR